MDIITMTEAKAQGLKQYFTGKPCNKGHVATRSTSSRQCMECGRLRHRGNEKRYATIRAWREANREKVNAYYRGYAQDPAYRLHMCIGTSVGRDLQGRKSRRRWEKLVGYSMDQLKTHLEKQFLPGMAWENYGKWHIDHIRPRRLFDRTEEGVKASWCLSNLRPLWAADNIRKSDKHLFLL